MVFYVSVNVNEIYFLFPTGNPIPLAVSPHSVNIFASVVDRQLAGSLPEVSYCQIRRP